jgi:hypothetical protein
MTRPVPPAPPPAASRGAGASAQAWFARNRLLVLAGAAGVAVVLGLRARLAGGGDPGGGSGGSGVQAAQLVPGGSFDSTANDLWNVMSPVLEAQSRQIQGLSDQLGKSLAPGPVTTPKPPAKKQGWHAYKVSRSGDTINAIIERANPGASWALRNEWAKQATQFSRIPAWQKLKPGQTVPIFWSGR